MVEWETWETNINTLLIIETNDPVACAIYDEEKKILKQEGCKRFRLIERRQINLLYIVRLMVPLALVATKNISVVGRDP